ncbi:MAG: DUF202 domain-containing protein [Gemmatimonadaceae bacterium]
MLPLSDRLAITRTELANERTLLSYARTALAIAAGGVGLVELFDTPPLVALGWLLMPLAAVVLVVGVVRYRRARSEYRGMGVDAGADPVAPRGSARPR